MRYRFSHPDADAKRHSVHSHVMLRLLGVKSLPRLGMPLILLPGISSDGKPVRISTWVAPHVPKFRKVWNGSAYVDKLVKTSVHRVRCACPGCGIELSAGRLFQHVCAVKPGEVTSAELADEELLRTRNVQRHPPSYSCDCAECRAARSSPSNPHGYVSRREEP